ncbi:hypothetical protein PNA2_1725 [Pyrococcus sp. NA2]|uniref:hypothetical protein n=1 Tax=Pyrococcus sp. (strain NA2) TaxID=342949 RepID=UPI000209AB17|nr:hypothetical protein [Pyrococcus sp. NA2]AEC52640.1 hypothetical protein PNA2_1725 [Pyrococcus sp. NA2]
MYRQFKISFLVLLLVFPLVSGGSCEPYETYSITSILPGNGYAFIVVHHSEWICERIAGEETLRRNMPDGEYDLYYLFNGNNLLFLGKSNHLLGEPSVVAEINGTFYILQHREEIIPYKNITLIINGEARKLTITAKKIEMKVYRLDECANLVWNCTRVELQNGTIISNCKENPILNYFFTGNTRRSLVGIRGKLQGGFLTFANSTYKIPVTELERYFLSFLNNNEMPKALSTLHALSLGGGILIYYPGEIKIGKGSPLLELPLIFFYDGENLRHLDMSTDMQELSECGGRFPVCKLDGTPPMEKSQKQSTNSNQTESNKKEACGIGTLLLLMITPLVLKKLHQVKDN